MPIYEYRCQSCGHELEAMQKMSDPLLTDCPSCGQSELQKLISASGFRLKGGGWYETDFKSGSKRNVAEKASEAAPACASGPCCGGGSCATT
jgi:putative FmdB family regulatory protein